MQEASDPPSRTGATGFAALLGFVLGVALQLQQAQLWQSWMYMPFVLLAPVFIAPPARKLIANQSSVRAVACLLLLGLALGWGSTGLRSGWFAAGALNPTLEGRDVQVVGVVADMVQPLEAGLRFGLNVESATLDGVPVTLPYRMDVAWYSGPLAAGDEVLALQRQPQTLQAGERWAMTVRPKAPHGNLNPHGFDYELMLWEQGVQATAYVRSGAKDTPPSRLGQTWTHPVAWARQTVRDRIIAALPDRQAAGLVAALVVGDQAAIERSDWDVFRATGVAHLVSISGLHITMFAWGAALLVGWLWRRSNGLCAWVPAPAAAALAALCLAMTYSIFSGWGLPAQRTCLMLLVVTGLRLAGARWPWPQVWMLACAAVVAADPWALLQPGFWLSFVAVGLLFATDSGAVRADSTGARGRIVALAREQWVVTVGLAPLTLLLFGQVSVVGLVANAFAIPWVTLVITPLAMVGALLPAVWDGAVLAIGVLMVWLRWQAQWPGAAVHLAQAPLGLALLAALGAGVLVFPWQWRMRLLGVPLLLPLLLWKAPVPAWGDFELLAADIGQGNAVLVRTAGHALLFDAGPRYSLESDAGHRVLVPLLQGLDVHLDMLVLSHRDTDHVGGAATVLAQQPQAQLLSSLEPGHPLQALRPSQRCEAGQQWVWDGVTFTVLHPLATDYGVARTPNALSCVLRISNGRSTALLTGDIEKPQEERLVTDALANGTASSLRADVLLVPHHGSKTSSSPEFLDTVAPALAVVQSGYRNRFGHPAPPVMDRYRERRITVLDSPHCGALVWRSNSPDAVVCQREVGRRVWHHRIP